jgi:hypothetical protein
MCAEAWDPTYVLAPPEMVARQNQALAHRPVGKSPWDRLDSPVINRPLTVEASAWVNGDVDMCPHGVWGEETGESRERDTKRQRNQTVRRPA